MKYIKSASYVIVVLIVIGIGYKGWQYLNKPQVITRTTSPDSTYKSPDKTTLRPKSIPLEKKDKPIVREPEGVAQKDIARTYRIITKDSTGHKDTVSVVILKNGQALADNKDGKVSEFLQQEYLEPILNFDFFLKIGIDGTTEKVSPVVGLGFCRILGRVDLPVFSLDLHGIGAGADYQIAEPISIGIMIHDSWNTDKSLRLSACYNL
jgi:hypothetical protein